jgi:hypothetical protein
MRRPVLLAAVVLALCLLPCQAQRGAGFHGGSSGFHGAPARPGGFAGRPAMGPATGGHMGFAHAPVPSSSFHPHGSSGWGGNPHFGHHHGGVHIRTVPWWWYGRFGYPYYYGAYYPFWWDWNSSSYDDSDQRDYQRATMRQIDDLSQEVQRLRLEREQEQNERETAAVQPPPPARAEPTKAAPTADLPVILVYMDKHIEEVKNYAVVGETLWAFGDRTKKIPLMDIDLAATGKLNDERGVDFQVPGRILNR